MTTKVTVQANGHSFPARVEKIAIIDGAAIVIETVTVPHGFSYEMWVGHGQTISVIEDYQPDVLVTEPVITQAPTPLDLPFVPDAPAPIAAAPAPVPDATPAPADATPSNFGTSDTDATASVAPTEAAPDGAPAADTPAEAPAAAPAPDAVQGEADTGAGGGSVDAAPAPVSDTTPATEAAPAEAAAATPDATPAPVDTAPATDTAPDSHDPLPW